MPLKLNLGCNDSHIDGYVNVDRCEPADQIVDLAKPALNVQFFAPAVAAMLPSDHNRYAAWPWEDSSVDAIRAHDVIEHLPSPIHTMNEIWRVLKPSARVEIWVPTTEGRGAWQDPTHISFWNRNSFLYYTAGDAHRERFGDHYGVKARFRVVEEEQRDGPMQVVKLKIVLEAVK